MTEANQPKLVRPKVNKILTTTLLFILANITLSVVLTRGFYLDGAQEMAQYATIGSVPHTLLGAIFQTLIFIGIGGVILRVPFHRVLKFLRPQRILDFARWGSYVAALFAFYLSYAEISILGIIDYTYLAQQLLIFVILGLEIWANAVISGGKKETQVCEFC